MSYVLGRDLLGASARVYFAATANDAAAAGFDDSRIYAEFQRPPGDRQIPLQPMKHEASLEPFRAWERKSDHIAY